MMTSGAYAVGVISPRVGMEWCALLAPLFCRALASRRVAYICWHALTRDVCYSAVRDSVRCNNEASRREKCDR